MAEAKQAEAEYFALQEEEAVLLRRLRDIQLTKGEDQLLFSRTRQDPYGYGDYHTRTHDPLASLRRQVQEEVLRREAQEVIRRETLGRRQAKEAALKQMDLFQHRHPGLRQLRPPLQQEMTRAYHCPGNLTSKNKVSRLFLNVKYCVLMLMPGTSNL